MSETYCRCYDKGMTMCPIHGGRPANPDATFSLLARLSSIESKLDALKPSYVAVPVQTVGEWHGDWTKVRAAIAHAVAGLELSDPDTVREAVAVIEAWHP